MGKGRAADPSEARALPGDAGRAGVWHSYQAYPGFRVLFHSTLGTNCAFWMWSVASGWLALLLTDSAFFVGLTSFLGGIPMLLFSLPAGVLIDRMDRRAVLLAAQGAVTVVAGVVAVLLFLDALDPWHLLVAAFCSGAAMAFVFPTRNALVANLVPLRDLANAVALNAAGQNAPRVVGPALAGPLIALVGVGQTILLCALIQLVTIAITARLPRAVPASTAARRTLRASLLEGLAAIRRSEYLTGLMVLAAVPTMLLMPYQSLLPVFAAEVLRIGSGGLGALMAANGLGAVIGSLLVAGSSRLVQVPALLCWAAAAFGALVLLFALTPWVPLATVLIFLSGVASAVYMALNNTAIQLSVDDAVRGRVLSVYLLTWGLLPIGTLPAGAVAEAYGVSTAVAGMAALALALIALAALRFPSLRRAAERSTAPS